MRPSDSRFLHIILRYIQYLFWLYAIIYVVSLVFFLTWYFLRVIIRIVDYIVFKITGIAILKPNTFKREIRLEAFDWGIMFSLTLMILGYLWIQSLKPKYHFEDKDLPQTEAHVNSSDYQDTKPSYSESTSSTKVITRLDDLPNPAIVVRNGQAFTIINYTQKQIYNWYVEHYKAKLHDSTLNFYVNLGESDLVAQSSMEQRGDKVLLNFVQMDTSNQ